MLHQFLGYAVVPDDYDLPQQVVLFPEILVNPQEEEPVGQHEHCDPDQLKDDEGPADDDLVKEIKVKRYESGEIKKRVHRSPRKGLKINDRLTVVDTADRGRQYPADVHKIQEIVVFQYGRNGQAPPEKELGEEKDEIDNGQVQHDQGDLEMVHEPVVHKLKFCGFIPKK
jgi:hypothetical protein